MTRVSFSLGLELQGTLWCLCQALTLRFASGPQEFGLLAAVFDWVP